MKLSICDVCYYQGEGSEKITEATHRTGMKQGARSLRIDACKKHKDFFNDCKDLDACEKKYLGLVNPTFPKIEERKVKLVPKEEK